MDGFNRRVATGKVHWYPGKSAKKKKKIATINPEEKKAWEIQAEGL